MITHAYNRALADAKGVERAQGMVARRVAGETLDSIAADYNLSAGRVGQITVKWAARFGVLDGFPRDKNHRIGVPYTPRLEDAYQCWLACGRSRSQADVAREFGLKPSTLSGHIYRVRLREEERLHGEDA